MKIILSFLILCLSTHAFAYSMQELEGKYKITCDRLKMQNILTIDRNGNLEMTNKAIQFQCTGKAKINAKNMIDANLKCPTLYNNRIFTFDINLAKVQDINNFKAPLMFPMIGETQWTFERLEN